MDKLKISVDSYRLMTGLKYKNKEVYNLVYGINPPSPYAEKRRGTETKIWNGIIVDSNLENRWLEGLNSIEEVKIRSACEGHNINNVSYLKFKVPTDRYLDLEYLRKIIRVLYTGITLCDYDMDKEGLLIYLVTAKIWYGHPDWKDWWETLEERIRVAVKE